MIITLCSWIWIGLSAYVCGNEFFELLTHFSEVRKNDFFRRMLAGLLVLTVYAEVFSLFRGVGLTANVVLLAADLFFLVRQRRKVLCDFKALLSFVRAAPVLSVFVICFSAVVLLRSSMLLRSGDSYLYHAQAIHWISEYGVVPGLGNLHTRYAFNSSFLCLQALFSLPFVTGGLSLHSVNGFIVLLMLCYSFSSNKYRQTGSFFASDFLRLAMIFYCVKESDQISSPGTDLFAMTLAIYILCEWGSLAEEDTGSSPCDYGLLCLFILLDVSLKLSSAMLLFLALFPAFQLIRQKQWRNVIFLCVTGAAVLAPFLIRNVVISGWLVYPVRFLNLFDFDWQIPAETLTAECSRTFQAAKGTYGSSVTSLREWFPAWVSENGIIYVVLMFLDAFSAVILLAHGSKQLRQKQSAPYLPVVAVLILCLLYWWFSAPAVRFGFPFMVMLPLLLAGVFISEVVKPTFRRQRIRTGYALVLALSLFFLYRSEDPKREHILYPADYANWTGTPTEVNDITFYLPDRMNWISYYYFPSALNEDVFSNIEMRGDSLQNGFRPKPGVEFLF